jgi:hypothetical protein
MRSFVAQKSTKSPSQKMNSVGTCFLIGTEKIWLRESHPFGMFLIEKKYAKLSQQISGPHSTCEDVAAGTVGKIRKN